MAVDAVFARAGKLSYLQIPARDPPASAAFYTAVFGWSTSARGAHISFTDASGELLGAFVTDREPASTPGFLPYIYVDDIAASLDAITAAGGVIARAPYAEGPLTVATFRDPAGNVLGIWRG